ncbi:MAG: hypothetical protein V4622_06790 [Bacteroidota bacterium]
MIKTLITILLFPLICISQNDTLNKYLNGKKNGTWMVYLDRKLNPIEDSSFAFFIAYENYDLGDRIFKYYKHPFKDVDSVMHSEEWPVQGKPQILSGIFKWYSTDGKILGHEEYRDGLPWYMKTYQYYNKKPQKCGFNEVLDWSKNYNGIFGTYYYEEYWDEKLDFYGWFRKGKRGWRVYKEKK